MSVLRFLARKKTLSDPGVQGLGEAADGTGSDTQGLGEAADVGGSETDGMGEAADTTNDPGAG
jgi:hypothetical protein